jgi:hypothetical protein
MKLELERLDDRLVPSATSAISIGSAWFLPPARDLYAIEQSTQQVLKFETSFFGHWEQALGGPRVLEVSASIDPHTGWSEVFALSQDSGHSGSLWLCDSGGQWHDLGGSYKHISATRDGQVYAVAADGSHVLLFNQNGQATDLGAPADWSGPYANAVAAGRGLFGQDEVFVTGPDSAIYVNSANAPGQWRLVDNSANFQTLSATQDDQVFALDDTGQLHQENEYSFWFGGIHLDFWAGQNLGGSYRQISADTDATGHGEVYALANDAFSSVYEIDQGTQTSIAIGVTNVAGADGGYNFDVTSLGNVYLYDPYASPWQHFTYLGSDL